MSKAIGIWKRGEKAVVQQAKSIGETGSATAADSFCPLNDTRLFLPVASSKFTSTTKTFNMKQHIPLKRFEYCTAEQGATADNRVNFEIDFEKGNLALEGEGIKIKTTIYPGFSVDLSDKTNDELVFSLQGIMEDGKTINSCSGLLVLYCSTEKKARADVDWRVAVYLYDDYEGDREIKLNLTMSLLTGNPELN
jgi:hypothetical protein